MQETSASAEVYEPPALVEAGEFAEVTLGPPWGLLFDHFMRFRHW